MDGYGTVVTLDRGRLQEYQVTGVSCLKGSSAERAAGAAPGRYTTPDGEIVTVRPAGPPNRALLHWDGSPGDRGLRRGVPPHITTPVFTPEELEHGRDTAFDRAVAELGR
ncbi:hypothetical protein [Streptomyces sp. URMC 123]|uniref:hypothetical protein n=1 Tax=Streptomyces sp. URMC 123 TaxID=3423403 RepID=UPI003F196871